MLTGESVPVRKESGGKVIAGSINGDGALKIKATGVGKDSYLNKVINLVQDAQAAKSNTQNLADKVAKWLTIVAVSYTHLDVYKRQEIELWDVKKNLKKEKKKLKKRKKTQTEDQPDKKTITDHIRHLKSIIREIK